MCKNVLEKCLKITNYDIHGMKCTYADNEHLLEAAPQYLLVFFNGDVKHKEQLHRVSWISEFRKDFAMVISVPSLYVSDNLTLAWYGGSIERNSTIDIHSIIYKKLEKLKLKFEDLILTGSSGGGFAALRMAAFFPGCSVFIENPQTNIFLYHKEHVDKYILSCFPGYSKDTLIERFNHRFSLIDFFNQIGSLPRFIYRQNLQDGFHLRNHFNPFLEFFQKENSKITHNDEHIFEIYNKVGEHNAVSDLDQFITNLNRLKHLKSHSINIKQSTFYKVRSFQENVTVRVYSKTESVSESSDVLSVYFLEHHDQDYSSKGLTWSNKIGWYRHVAPETKMFSRTFSIPVSNETYGIVFTVRNLETKIKNIIEIEAS